MTQPPLKLRVSRMWQSQTGDRVPPNFLPSAAAQTNRRRRRVFLGTLTIALVLSLAFTWLRSPEYRATALLQITAASESPALRGAAGSAPESAKPFLTEVQVLTSRPVLETVAAQLQGDGRDLSGFGPDPVAGMQSRLEAIPITSTNVVELVATGPSPGLLAPLLNAIIAVYQERLERAFRSATSESMAQADDEVKKLQATVVAKRRDAEAFRIRNDIVSLQRDENEVLARVRNLSTSLSAANDRVAAAEGKVRALSASAAAGKSAVRSRDDPTLANLEQRASQIREEFRDLERGFTPDYLAKDPKVITQRARLAELERQIAAQRAASQQTAIVEAQEELAGAQGASARIQSQMLSTRQEATQFNARFNEYKSRQDELGELETAYRDAVQRRAKLEASERARTPTTKVLEAATTPQQAWRPLYWRDTALAIGGSLALALLVMWLVELLNRPEAQPAVVLIQPQPGALLYEPAPQALVNRGAPAMSLGAAEPTLLPRPTTFPRELRVDEAAALIAASDDEIRLLMGLLLSGVTLDEALELRWSDVDLARGTLRAGGESGRELYLGAALRRLLETAPKVPGSEMLVRPAGQPATRDSVDAQVLGAAHDAAIDDAPQVTSACLRHTYIAFLMRQGIRFADLTRLVGPLAAEAISAYGALSPAGARRDFAQIQVLYPALQEGNA
jgi:succinoglycan biosynthesis transport protein ExoP